MGLRVVNFATSKNLIFKGTMFPHEFFKKITCPSSDRKTHNKTDNCWVGSRWQSSILYLICVVSEEKRETLGTEV